jgi:hypothetical protein
MNYDNTHDYKIGASRGSNYVKFLMYKDKFDMNKVKPEYRPNLALTVKPKKAKKIYKPKKSKLIED